MKKITILLSLLLASGIAQAAPPMWAADTLNHYVIDNVRVENFDGSQLEGKTIVSYQLQLVNVSPEVAIRVHEIRTGGAVQVRKRSANQADPVYVVNGKKVSKREFENLNPAAIKSITVAKNGIPEEVRQYPGWENGVILVEIKEDASAVADTKDRQVNIGYGVSESQDVSYSVSSVKSEEKEFYTSMTEYLRGKVAGVQVGPDDSIIIRGVTTMNASKTPLIMVDGVEISDINLVNPQDVYSVDVLKDASTAIYGMRGANGAILITTKMAHEANVKTRKQ